MPDKTPGSMVKREADEVAVEIDEAPMLQITRGEVDMQVSTAKQYPRSLKKFTDEVLSMATLDEATAESCTYAFQKGGKLVDGASIRFAEIVALCWGNLRVEAQVVGEEEKWVHARATTWDMERNVLVRLSGRRRILNKYGKRFSDDMIATTAAAARAIEYRNTVLKVVPKAYWGPILRETQKVAKGTIATLLERRTNAMKFFARFAVDQTRVLAYLGKESMDEVDLDDVAKLVQIKNGIKENGVNIDDVFPPTVSLDKPGRVGFSKARPVDIDEAPAPTGGEPPEPEDDEIFGG